MTAVGASAATWRLWPDDGRRKAADLAEQARLALVDDVPAGAARGVDLLQQATALRPEDAALWGKLALAWRAVSESGRATEVGEATKASELAAFRALGLDPRQGDARTALITLRATYGDWLAVERGLRAVLVDEPRNDAATGELAALLQSVGRSGESFTLVQAVAARQPLSPTYQYRLAFALWIQGRLGEADQVIDRAFALWPRHQAVWSTRVWLMGFTGRARVALAQIEDPETRPVRMTAPALALLQTSMRAVETGLPADVKAAVDANMAAALHGPGNAVGAILVLSALHRLDEAFSVANGYLLRRGSKLMPLRTQPGQASFSDTGHRHTQALFIPVTAPLRADPRFLPMCDECGLGEYWRLSGHAPDFLTLSRGGPKA